MRNGFITGKNKKAYIFLLILLAEGILLFCTLRAMNREQTLTFSSEELLTVMDREKAETVSGFYTDPSLDGAHVITSPRFWLEKGIYTVTLEYESNGPGEKECYSSMTAVDARDRSDLTYRVDCDQVYLNGSGASVVQYKAYVNDASDVRVQTGLADRADGIYLLIRQITVTYMRRLSMAYMGSRLLFFILLADVCVWLLLFFRMQTAAWLRVHALPATALPALLVIAVYPSFHHGVFFGDDIWYHLNRLVNLAEGLSAGAFPVRIHPGWEGGYGYAAGIGYSDLFLLPSALLLLLGYPMAFAYKFYIFFMSALTVFFSYIAFEKISGARYIGLGCSALYVLYGFHLSDIYNGARVGSFGAYAFVPLVILALWQIYATAEEGVPQKERQYAWLLLAVGVTCVLQTHMITTVQLAILIPVFCLLNLRRTLKREVLLPLCRALVLSVLLNLWFLVPLTEYLLLQGMEMGSFGRTFVLLRNVLDPSWLFVSVIEEDLITAGWSGAGMASLLILALCAFLLLRGAFEKRSGTVFRLFLLTVLLLWMSTNLFPWYRISRSFPQLYALFESMEFSWRLLNPASALLALLAALSLKRLGALWQQANAGRTRAAQYVLLTALCTVCGLQAVHYMTDQITYGNVIMVNNIGPGGRGDEFVLKNARGHGSGLLLNGAQGEIVGRAGTTIRAEITNAQETAVQVEFPLWAYRGYAARSKQGELPVGESAGRTVSVEIPAGFQGEVEVYFREPWYWRGAELISAAMIFVTAVRSRKARRKERGQEKGYVDSDQ